MRNPETGEISTDLSGQKVVMGGGVFVIPFVQKPRHARPVVAAASRCRSAAPCPAQGIKLNLDGVAIVKVGGNEDSIRAAAQRFLSQQSDIETFTQEVLAGALRSIVGSADRRADHPRPGGLRPAGGRGVRVVPDRPGPGARHLPDPGHHRRRLLPRGPRPPRGRPAQPARLHRRGQRPSGGRAGPHRRRAGDRGHPARPRPARTPRSRPRPTPPTPRQRPPARSPRPTATRPSSSSRRRSPSGRRR